MAKQYLDGNGVRYLWTKLKNLLNDTVPSKSDVAANTEARHTHSNKAALDGISTNNITSWNNKTDNYIVTLTQDGDIYTADNWQGIEAAYNANKRVYISNQGTLIPLVVCMSGVIAAFYLTVPETNNTIQCFTYAVSLTNGTVTVSQTDYTIPSATSSLTNDSGFITSADGGNAATVNGLKFVVASEAPTNADSNTITFVV